MQRFYVLLAGEEAKRGARNASGEGESERFMGSVILDVKFEPRPAVTTPIPNPSPNPSPNPNPNP